MSMYVYVYAVKYTAVWCCCVLVHGYAYDMYVCMYVCMLLFRTQPWKLLYMRITICAHALYVYFIHRLKHTHVALCMIWPHLHAYMDMTLRIACPLQKLRLRNTRHACVKQRSGMTYIYACIHTYVNTCTYIHL